MRCFLHVVLGFYTCNHLTILEKEISGLHFSLTYVSAGTLSRYYIFSYDGICIFFDIKK